MINMTFVALLILLVVFMEFAWIITATGRLLFFPANKRRDKDEVDFAARTVPFVTFRDLRNLSLYLAGLQEAFELIGHLACNSELLGIKEWMLIYTLLFCAGSAGLWLRAEHDLHFRTLIRSNVFNPLDSLRADATLECGRGFRFWLFGIRRAKSVDGRIYWLSYDASPFDVIRGHVFEFPTARSFLVMKVKRYGFIPANEFRILKSHKLTA
jgi:hypothetical protein